MQSSGEEISDETYEEMTEQLCTSLRDAGLVDLQYNIEYRIFNVISFLSVAGSILVFLTSFWNEKLNTHPYKLVSAIALIDATFFLIFNTLDETCNLELNKIFSATVFFSLQPEDVYRALDLQIRFSTGLFKSLFCLSFILNAFLCIDLYLTVKRPFAPGAKRMKQYILLGVLFAVTASFVSTWHYNRHWISTEGSTDLEQRMVTEELTILVTFTIFVAVAIPSTIFASKRILRKGVSADVRSTVISRHIKYILILVLTFVFYAQKIVTEIFFHKTEVEWLDELSVYIFAS